MFDTVFGLPTHVLINHAVVVLLPLAALASTAIAIRARWRRRLGWWVVGFNLLMAVVAWVTKESGERLFERLERPPAAVEHQDRGELLVWLALALFAVALVLVLVGRASQGVLVGILAGLTIGAAVAATVQVVRVGHSGANAVWESTVENTEPPS